MKNVLLALTAVVSMTGSAFAADLAARPYTKAPAAPVAVAPTWTGCYVGGGGGYGLYDIESQQIIVATGLARNPNIDQGGRGWIGTIQAGCDYQFPIGTNQFVIGAFGDYNWSDIRGDFTGQGGAVGLVSGREKVDNYWAVGGRIGWLVNPQTLTYFSGGYTQAHRTGVTYLNAVGVPTGVGLQGGTTSGWFLGSGIEHTVGWIPGLTWKTEYRFSEYDRRDNLEFSTVTGLLTGNASRDKLFTHTVTSTLSYRFTWGGTPVVAKY
jgi:outer membrane immunogenic protein